MRADDKTPIHTRKITIAIDGFSSCGKSTLAQDLAKKLDYIYIDSGAMYRAVTLYIIRREISLDDEAAVKNAMVDISIGFSKVDGLLHTTLNGEDVEHEIRTLRVSHMVSPVAALSNVRRVLVNQQREFGLKGGVVMDGRDIGTVVFPNAELKLFVTASLEERIRRRSAQLRECGMEVTEEEVARSITERDRIDTTREDSPLMQADSAIVLDNTDLTREDQLELAYNYALQAMAN